MIITGISKNNNCFISFIVNYKVVCQNNMTLKLTRFHVAHAGGRQAAPIATPLQV